MEALALREPENFEVAVQEAIIGSRTERAAKELLRVALAKVRHKGELRILRNIALMGEEAAVIGDELAELLDDPNANVRLGASRTLGFTGRLDLWPHLARALKDSDWRVAFSACVSLGQLKAKGADVSLENLGKQHWYPRVRHAASYARSLIQGKEPSQEDVRHVGGEASIFFLYEQEDLSLLPLKESQPAFPPLPKREFIIWGGSGSDNIIEGSFRAKHPELHAAISTLPESRRGGDLTILTGILEKEGVNFVALRAGEWVGGLFAVDKMGKASLLIDENIMELLDWNGRIVALGGLSHMGMDHGSLYEVTMEDGKAAAKLLRALPGCPWRGAILPDGRLFANCEGGAVAISSDNTITYLGSGDGRPEE
ncbi:HEAT repeat domain-containing protein [Luteolibacter luteus]|uniref:HEAT repeat domain-containing protein n=1 Tax=Luteolibacter luteus TaxID=2728835 RepID=A0A858RE62_9BACT|nr:HEAT repeat domain-containing protein [Luteolibacter luteus]QJE94848.1 HEAT repeat domain-containing protein [Luteolibacter luteus]